MATFQRKPGLETASEPCLAQRIDCEISPVSGAWETRLCGAEMLPALLYII